MVSPSVVEEDRFLQYGDLLIARSGSVGRTYLHKKTSGRFQYAGYLIRFRIDPKKALAAFVFQVTQSPQWDDWILQHSKTGTISNINAQQYASFRLPLPPIEVQREIVAEIEGYQKVMDGACTVIGSYRPHVPIQRDWPMVPLGEICSFKNGLNFNKASSGHTVKIIGVSDFRSNLYAPLADLEEVHLDAPPPDEYLVRAGDILFVRSNGNPELVGRSLIVPPPHEPTTFSGFTIRGRIEDERAFPLFYAHYFKSRDFAEMIKTVGQGANIRNLSQGILNGLRVPLPALQTQRAIVADIEADQVLVAANRELIARFEKKIQATLARVWGDDEPFVTKA
jgi:type I restriction enzyme M protein